MDHNRTFLALASLITITLSVLWAYPTRAQSEGPQETQQPNVQPQDTVQQAPAVELPSENTEDSEPGITPTNGKTPTSSLGLYGYVMLDSGCNFGQTDQNWLDVMRPTKLDSFVGEFAPSGTVFFSVWQTRFGVKTDNQTDLGELKTIFEFELFGVGVDAGKTTFRLRHAYGEVGQFGAGQTWSPFMDPDVFPNSLEYRGPSGMVFFRNVQVRWMPLRGDTVLGWGVKRQLKSQVPLVEHRPVSSHLRERRRELHERCPDRYRRSEQLQQSDKAEDA